jgi:signal transduction histidine kinase/CheY-like chemotaxis protein
MSFESLLLEASSEILMLLDVQSLKIVSASTAAHQQLGYESPELIGIEIGEIECALSDLFFWEEMASSTKPMEAQGNYRRRDGSVFEIRKFAHRAGENQQYYLLRARPARRQRIDPEVNVTGLHLAATLEATDDGILLADIDGAILNMNHRLSNMMALPEALLAERDDHGIVAYIESILLKNPGASEAPTALSQAIELKLDLGGDTFETLYLADGRILECVSHPARDRDRTIGRVFCYRDVTERVQHEQYLQEARDIAEQATVSKGQFLANMSHEIRTPMNAILGMLKLMHATDLNARQFDYVDKAEGAAQSLLGLLNDILDFSKIEAGKLELDPQPFSPERVLRELSVILATNLGNKPVELLYDIDPRIPRSLMGDALRLQQILINLGGNALKFTQSGEVVVHMHLVETATNDLGHSVRLHIGVRDSGIGIAPENQTKIFGDFSQAEASTTRRYGGTGLGLSICKRMVALMGGELQLRSTLGVGSDFFFEIDLPRVHAETTVDPVQTDVPLTGLEVLIVDDNAVARELLASMMQSLGWKTECAASGADALERYQARARGQLPPYQALFVDWEMPGMDGWETLKQLRTLGAAFGSPINIMVAAHNRQALGQRSTEEQAGLHAFLVKPVTSAMLKEAVAEARAGRNNFRKKERDSTPSALRLNGMRLLVVEDNLVNQQVARELLKAEGAEVELADNGLIAVSIVTQARDNVPFDAILMDVQMPVMDGFTATRVLRRELKLDTLPIIAMTANAMASDREDCLQAGMTDHVGKPFDLNYLVKVLLKTSGFVPKPLDPQAAAASPSLAQPRTAPAPAPTLAPTPAPAPIATQVPAPVGHSAAPVQAARTVQVDVEGAIAQLEGMRSLYLELVQQYLAELHTIVPEFQRLLNASKMPEATRLMHTLKGTAATLGVTQLSQFALELETFCKACVEPKAALEKAPELEAMVNASIAALSQAIAVLQAELST